MFPLVLRNGCIGNAEPSEVLQQILQVGRVRVPVFSTSWLKNILVKHVIELENLLTNKSYVCLHMNVIPGDTVLSPGGDTAPHGKHQPLGPGQVDTVQGLLPLHSV